MKVLIIEDDITVQNFLRRGLKYKQCTVIQAFNGMDGLKKLLENEYAIAIIDLKLPLLDGVSVIEKAKARNIKTPLIVLTCLQALEEKTRLFELGIDDYMTKPFSFEELFARMTAVVRRSQNRLPTEDLEFADLKLMPAKRVVLRLGEKISLRKKEFALLEYLMQFPNKVISRTELMQNVWDYESFVLSNTVDSHMSSLRRKVDLKYKKKLIRTIYGIGYMLCEE